MNWIKDWIQERYEDNLHAYDELWAATLTAWEAVEGVFLMELLECTQDTSRLIHYFLID